MGEEAEQCREVLDGGVGRGRFVDRLGALADGSLEVATGTGTPRLRVVGRQPFELAAGLLDGDRESNGLSDIIRLHRTRSPR